MKYVLIATVQILVAIVLMAIATRILYEFIMWMKDVS